jgi:hypothetical protein
MSLTGNGMAIEIRGNDAAARPAVGKLGGQPRPGGS